ncbi:MAG: response regulator [Elusimicrobia bacterium]|nr:response regulator [Elusimicrobiota bacterium]
MNPTPRVKLLLVDDQPANLLALASTLESPALELVLAHSGQDALRWLLREEFAVVLLDVQMPGLDGFETAQLIRQRERTGHVPIIFVTAVNTTDTHVTRGYRLGAVDYIFKPLVPEILKAKVQAFVELFRKQRELRQSEERYRAVFSSVGEAILAVSDDTERIVDANEAAIGLFGYGRQELVGLHLDRLDAPGDKPGAATPAAVNGSVRWQRRKDGKVFPAEITEAPAQLDTGPAMIVVIRDVTERLQAAEAQQLRERDRMQREFVANVSHELRTPIAAIKGFSETLRRGAIDDDRNRLRFVRTIETHADRLAALVEDLLTLAAIESGRDVPQPKVVELEAFTRELVLSMSPLSGRRRVGIDLQLVDARLFVDAKHLSQVLQNLVDNAIKYNRPGGRVRVEAVLERDAVRVAVKDSGIGIPPDELPHIFTRFHRSARAKELAIRGTGLGLHIVKHIVEANGGRVWAESVPEQGSTFYFTVPLAKKSAVPVK